MAGYEITFSDAPAREDLLAIEEGYAAFTRSQVGEADRREVAFFLRDANGSVVGGVKGEYSNYGWLWVGILWVSDELRGRGYGTRLMGQIEQEAKRNGCTNVYLNSFSFQAVDFYKKLGYRVFGELEEFPPGHRVCSLTKELS